MNLAKFLISILTRPRTKLVTCYETHYYKVYNIYYQLILQVDYWIEPLHKYNTKLTPPPLGGRGHNYWLLNNVNENKNKNPSQEWGVHCGCPSQLPSPVSCHLLSPALLSGGVHHSACHPHRVAVSFPLFRRPPTPVVLIVIIVPSSPRHRRCPPIIVVVPPSSSLSPRPPRRRRRAPALCCRRPVVSPPVVGGGHRRCRRCRCVLRTAVSCYHPATPRAKARSGGGGCPSPSLSIKKLPRCFFC